MPFGEFIPPGFKWFTRMMDIPLGDFNRGALNAPSFDVKGERIAPNICYEDLFGEELAARFADPARAPTMFANLSNIGWFGDTIAIAQRYTGTAEATGKQLDLIGVGLWDVRDGKVARYRQFVDTVKFCEVVPA